MAGTRIGCLSRRISHFGDMCVGRPCTGYAYQLFDSDVFSVSSRLYSAGVEDGNGILLSTLKLYVQRHIVF
jgi:hypothetical protein